MQGILFAVYLCLCSTAANIVFLKSLGNLESMSTSNNERCYMIVSYFLREEDMTVS